MTKYWINKNGTLSSNLPSPLTGKTLAELVIMQETRALLKLLLKQVIPDDLRAAIGAAINNQARRMAPFMPLNDEQRLGWLDEASTLICRLNFGDSFTEDLEYPIRSNTITIKRIIAKKSLKGILEEVLISGDDLIISMEDNFDRTHTFCYGEVPSHPRLYAQHSLSPLISHFIIPPTPDVTQIFPASYKKYTETLSLL